MQTRERKRVTAMAQADALVVGAGAAGLAAARALSRHGLSVAILEARDRIGGRIHTVRPPGALLPIELGAEFIHGRPPVTFALAHEARLTPLEIGGDSWFSEHGQLLHNRDEEEEEDAANDLDRDADAADEDAADMGPILAALGAWHGEDMTFDAFVEAHFAGERWLAARQAARGYVEGFDAADAASVSIRWLAATDAAAAQIDGERNFRLLDGYDRLLFALRESLATERTALHLNTIVRDILWARGAVEIAARTPLGAALEPFTARAALVTLPLGVLAAPSDAPGAVRFTPHLPHMRLALQGVAMGPAIKVVLRFRDAFWDTLLTAHPVLALPRLSFLFSDDPVMRTWWTDHPALTPTLTAWAAGPRAAALASLPDDAIAQQALAALARVLGVERAYLDARLDAWHLHNWSADPFARGAYSYVRAGGADALDQLAAPVEDTLFFAGEATSYRETGTVHGALASGERAAAELIATLSR
ncbi:MAG: flavin monoamine oxidase family protein [Ktedonobacterales bacterium]